MRFVGFFIYFFVGKMVWSAIIEIFRIFRENMVRVLNEVIVFFKLRA